VSVSSLFELNTGLPFTLTESDFEESEPEGYLDVFHARVSSLMPEVDTDSIERIVVQYGLQISAQHAYELRHYDSPVLLVEPKTRYVGLVKAQLSPYIRDLRARTVRLGEPSDRTQAISERFGVLVAHYLSMRDDAFVDGLAKELDPFLR